MASTLRRHACVFVIVVAWLSACGDAPRRAAVATAASESGDHGNGPDDTILPFDRTLAQIAGLDIPSINRAITQIRANAALSCVIDRGFKLTEDQSKNLANVPEFDSSGLYPSNVEVIIEASRDLTPIPIETQTAIDQCVSTTFNIIEDPLQDYNQWSDQVISDLAVRVRSDREYSDAVRAEVECIRRLGYGDTSPETVLASFSSDALKALDDRKMGQLDEGELDAMLLKLLEGERTLAGHLEACIGPRLKVERRVLGSLEEAFLDDNGDSIRQLGYDVKARLIDLGLVE